MDDDRLNELLRDLPRASAGPGFKARVLARIDGDAGRPRLHARSFVWTAAAAACVVATLSFAAWRLEEQRQARVASERRGQFEALRAEQRALREELARLQQINARPPEVYLGGDERVDFVLDLARPQPRGPGARGASYGRPLRPEP